MLYLLKRSVVVVETKKMTIYINPQIHTEIKILAARQGRSISEVSEEALRIYLEELEAIEEGK
jgi:predicted HicB family RNase H-like nuclease